MTRMRVPASAYVLCALLSLLVASLASPAQNPVGTACTGAGIPGPACRTGEAATNSLAWMCRHAGGPEDQCSALDGRSIRSEHVDGYETSAAHLALVALRASEDPLAFTDAYWHATHNSFNSAWYAPTLSGQDPNQEYSMTDQLRMDARILELDLHWFHTASGQRAVVCHARPGSEGHAGCTNERDLAAVLPELKSWLDSNHEVIAVDIDDYLDHDDGRAAAAEVFLAIFGELILRPEEHGAACTDGLPPLSRDRMRELGRRVVLLGANCSPDGWAAIVHGKTNLVQQAWPFADCGWDESETGFRRVWEDDTVLGAWVTETGIRDYDSGPLNATDLRALLACPIGSVALDHLHPQDERLPALAEAWLQRFDARQIAPTPPTNTTTATTTPPSTPTTSQCPDGAPPKDGTCAVKQKSPLPGALWMVLVLAAVAARSRLR
jgi:hypothetical protein